MTHNEKLQVIRAMLTRGGSFVKRLGQAWLHADDDNSRRIEAAFPEIITEYARIASLMQDEAAP